MPNAFPALTPDALRDLLGAVADKVGRERREVI
jgi:hypothetical protein